MFCSLLHRICILIQQLCEVRVLNFHDEIKLFALKEVKTLHTPSTIYFMKIYQKEATSFYTIFFIHSLQTFVWVRIHSYGHSGKTTGNYSTGG